MSDNETLQVNTNVEYRVEWYYDSVSWRVVDTKATEQQARDSIRTFRVFMSPTRPVRIVKVTTTVRHDIIYTEAKV